MYLNPNENNIVYLIDNRLNYFNQESQTQNNLYSGYNESNNAYQIYNGNNLTQNNIQPNIIPQSTNQVNYINDTYYQNQIYNYTDINGNGNSNTLNYNNINNAQNMNEINNINQNNQINYINQNTNTVKTEEEKGTPLDSDRNKIKKTPNDINKLIPLNIIKSNKNKSKINKLKLNEQILLRNQKQSLNKDLDVKTHFDIEVTKEKYVFPYKKVLKIAIPLLSQYDRLQILYHTLPQIARGKQFSLTIDAECGIINYKVMRCPPQNLSASFPSNYQSAQSCG